MAWTEDLRNWMDTISSPYQAEDGTIYTQDYIQSADGSTRWYKDGRTDVISNYACGGGGGTFSSVNAGEWGGASPSSGDAGGGAGVLREI